jgi:hypothetical protein
METPEVIKKKAAIVRASHSDMLWNGTPLENKKFFLKNPWTKEFEGTYTISGTDRYDIIEIHKGLALDQFYKISEAPVETDFQCFIFLKKAEHWDLLYSPKWPKLNTLYYKLVGKNQIVGPLFLNKTEGVDTIKKGLEQGTYYVLHKKQLFQPVEVEKKSA